MGEKKQLAGVEAVTRYNPARGSEIIPIPVEPPQALFGVLWFFAVLAYPGRSDSKDRKDFAKALHSWRCKNARGDIGYWQQVPAEIRGMRNRSIRGKLHLGLKRIRKRLTAGSIAFSIYLKGLPIPGFNPTRTAGIEVFTGGGVTTVTEGLKEVLRQREELTGKRNDRNEPGEIERDTLENARTDIWTKSLPVLHLAVTLHAWLRDFPTDEQMSAELYRLIHDPRWLRAALEYAENWRELLHTHRIPSFDKGKAIRLVRAD
jgi:hypothetical protein